MYGIDVAAPGCLDGWTGRRLRWHVAGLLIRDTGTARRMALLHPPPAPTEPTRG